MPTDDLDTAQPVPQSLVPVDTAASPGGMLPPTRPLVLERGMIAALEDLHNDLRESTAFQLSQEAEFDEQSLIGLTRGLDAGVQAAIARLKLYLAASSISLAPNVGFEATTAKLTPLDKGTFPTAKGATTRHFQVKWEVDCMVQEEENEMSEPTVLTTCALSIALARQGVDRTGGWAFATRELELTVDHICIRQDALNAALKPPFSVPPDHRDKVLMDLLTGTNIEAAIRAASMTISELDKEHIETWQSTLSKSISDASQAFGLMAGSITRANIEAGCKLLEHQLIGYIGDSELLPEGWSIEEEHEDELPTISWRSSEALSATRSGIDSKRLEMLAQGIYQISYMIEVQDDDAPGDDDSRTTVNLPTIAKVVLVCTPSLTWEVDPLKTQIMIEELPVSEMRNTRSAS